MSPEEADLDVIYKAIQEHDRYPTHHRGGRIEDRARACLDLKGREIWGLRSEGVLLSEACMFSGISVRQALAAVGKIVRDEWPAEQRRIESCERARADYRRRRDEAYAEEARERERQRRTVNVTTMADWVHIGSNGKRFDR